jgi:hypothetical protein
MTRKVMKLVNPSTGQMECQICGRIHWASQRRGGHFYRGSWQCQHGCKLPAQSLVRSVQPEGIPAS